MPIRKVFDDSRCVFVGGLKCDLAPGKLKINLEHLFKCINLHVKKSHMLIIQNTPYSYGFVELEDVGTAQYVLHHLRTKEGRDKVRFDFSEIQDPDKQLKFEHKRPSRVPPASVNLSNNGENDSSLASAKNLPSSSSDLQSNTVQTSTTGLPAVTLSTPVLSPVQDQIGQVAMATSVSGLTPKLPERYYTLNEKLGNETRTVEFKRGGFVSSDRKYVLQDNIGKYVCAFLNTDGGTLFVGVNNDGIVVGITCDQQKEDKHRLSIDQAIKVINPHVLPSLYSVEFAPVLDNNSLASNLKVLEVKVKDTQGHGRPYDYNGTVFIRRDGSVQILEIRDLQEWLRKHQHEKDELSQKLNELREQLHQLESEKIKKVSENQEAKEEMLQTLEERTMQLHQLESEKIKLDEAEKGLQQKLEDSDKEVQRLKDKLTSLETEQHKRAAKKSQICLIM